MEKWIDRSYRHIGKYFDEKSVFYEKVKDISSNILHVHSMYSIYDSTMSPDELCETAVTLGCENITLTDHGTLLGIDPFMAAGKKYGINTIPGVETYREDRCHMLILARNYKGFIDISHAMREANTNIERKKIKTATRDYAMMTKEMCETYFKGNDDVIVTSACIQGTISRILLTNQRIRKSILKDIKKVEEYEDDAKKYRDAKKKITALKITLAEKKEERKKYTRYIGKGFVEKLEKKKEKLKLLEAEKATDTQLTLDIIDNCDSELDRFREDVMSDINLYENANRLIEQIDKEITDIKAEIEKNTIAAKELKSHYDAYMKSKEVVSETKYIDEAILYEQAKEEALWYKNTFPIFFIELQYHGIDDEAYVMPILVKLARDLDIPLIAANDAHMKDASHESVEARRIVRYNMISKAQVVSDADRELYLKTDTELAKWLSQVVDKDAVSESIFNTKILSTCSVIFPKENHYPSVNSDVSFEAMVRKGIEKRLIEGKIEEWTETYENRLKYEIKIMTDMGYVDYHKVVEDFCREGRILGRIPKDRVPDIPKDYEDVHRWIEENGFKTGVGIGPGRGSAVGSLVCFLLGITNIDPIKYNLLFERFLNPERVSMPDIDTDISTRLRPTLIRYLRWKYGEKSVCSIATELTYGAKAAIQMAGRDRASEKYASLSTKEYDYMCRSYLNKFTLPLSNMIPEGTKVTLSGCEEELKDYIESNSELQIIWNHAKLIEGKVQGTGVHAGGVIISDNDNINDYVPLAYNSDKDVWAAQCDMIAAEEKGLLKMDVLGLSTLDCISDCICNVRKYRGVDIDIDSIPFEAEVFNEIYSKGRTNSVFQFESAGMKSMLRQFKPSCFEDLILLVACYRPGPMQYLENIIKVKSGEIPVSYKTPQLESILSNTYGACVYQEQVMEIFQKLAGYSLGGADLVRRAMSKKKAAVLEKEREAFIHGDTKRNIDGCVKRGIREDIANELFDEMMQFSAYAFNKSHAAAYSYVSYQTAWLKYHYPIEYECAMLNNKEQEEYAPLLEDCITYGIKLLPPDINMSYFEHVIEDGNIRYGIGGIKGIGESVRTLISQIISNRRKDGYYNSIQDFLLRNTFEREDGVSFIPNKVLQKIADAGAFDSFGYDRECISSFKMDGSNYGKILSDINNYNFRQGRNLSYNLEHESELLGTVLSFDPLSAYGKEKEYGCVNINEIAENETCSIMGYATSITEKKNKYGEYIYVIDFQSKAGKILVHTTATLKSAMRCGNSILYKVVKFTGSYAYGRFFAKSIENVSAYSKSCFVDLLTKEATNKLTEILNTDNEKRDIRVRIFCRFLLRHGVLTHVERPRIVERLLSKEELFVLGGCGADVRRG